MSSSRVLVVGGDPEDHLILQEHLRGAGIPDVFIAASCAEALTVVAARGVAVALVDVMQPAGDVLHLLRAASAKNGGGNVPVIVTGPSSASDRIAACLQRGAEDYVTTPYDAVHAPLLTRRIELCLQRARLKEFGTRVAAVAKDPNETETLALYSDASSRFIPREFLETLERKTLLEVKLGDHVLRDMTVFFSDIRDFTALSEQLTPQENFNFLNSYLQHVNPVIRNNHGFVDKYIGDAVMALFPRAAGDALRAATELQLQVAAYNKGRRIAGYDAIRVGIGMHRGELILGTIGEDERMQTTVIADAVNVASRIEGLTKTFGVALLVSASVVDALDPAHTFRLRHLGAVKAKGKTQSVDIFECYDNDPEELVAHKDKTKEAFDAAMEEFRKGMFLTAGKIFSRIAEIEPLDLPAAYYRDRCSLTAVRGRGLGVWDGAEKMEVK